MSVSLQPGKAPLPALEGELILPTDTSLPARVDLRFSSFTHSPSLVALGKLESISSDLILRPQNAYCLARISITPEGMEVLGNRQMQAGIPAEVVIKTGERTVLAYLLHPLLKRMAASMKEE